jgi:crotonobetainyl-CoA:carnitine CoA-transferase CaiB-like acyl-CoA transferase
VLDLSQGAAAPHCAMLLGQHGAEVIKVEPPSGDWSRALGALYGEHSALSLVYNLGKRSIALNLKSASAVEVVLRIAAHSDVVLESFRPGVADRLGIGFAAVCARNPRVIYASISGFGQRGPYRERPCSDTLAQAYTGLMSINRGADGVPHKVDTIVIDTVTGAYAFGAVAAALAGRHDEPHGVHLDLSLSACGAALQAPRIAQFALEGEAAQRLNSPAGTYRTADGWIAITLTRESHFRQLCDALDLPELARDARFADFAARAGNHDALVAILAERLRTRPTAQWRETLLAHDVLAERIHSHGDWLDDPQVRALDAAPPVDVPGVGEVRMPLMPGRHAHHGVPPRIGEHGEEVLAQFGYTQREIAALVETGALYLP